MPESRLVFLLSAATLCASALLAQTPPAPDVAPCGAPIMAAPPCADKNAPPVLATVDSTVFTANDLEPKLRDKVVNLDKAVADARREALDADIEEALLQSEAARLHVAPRQLYFDEVVRKVAAPTEADLKTEYDANERYRSRPFNDAREWLASVVADQREKARFAEFTKGLTARYPVEVKKGGGSTLATVGSRSITAADSGDALAAAEYGVRWSTWQEENDAVRKLVHDQLVKSEAARRGITAEALVQAEVDQRITEPTDADITAYYQKYRSFFADSLEAAKPQVIKSLQRERRQEAEGAFEKKLAESHSVRIALVEPPRPRLRIDTGASPFRGNAQASVTVVEFGDFQCPPCGRMYGIVEEALAPYGERVRYVFRNYPMGFHVFAVKAAEAAMAAQAQGKFWEYASLLFHNQKSLDVASLKKYAAEAGLDSARFAKDLDSGRFTPAVLEEKRIGARYGVTATPTFFISGIRLAYSDYSVEGIRAMVDAAMAAAKPPSTAAKER